MNCVPLPVLRGQGRYMSKQKKTEAKHGFQAVTSIIRKRGLSWIEGWNLAHTRGKLYDGQALKMDKMGLKNWLTHC